ncbi:hypothetical protein F8M41_018988 [Gigaspora margarita]|uniref:Uncharacterized protein n=1 Tax=Gigaspora margarita TaxID=4874 RepID=A0A8H4AKM7_GIGMA|nr:hypothetical protein F8M41_018988 [Gigaspora margarita]
MISIEPNWMFNEYEKTKKRVIEIEKFRKNKDNRIEKDQLISEDIAGSNNIDIGSFANDFAGLKICYINQKKDSKSWVYKMKSNLKELTKAVMDLTKQNKLLMYSIIIEHSL